MVRVHRVCIITPIPVSFSCTLDESRAKDSLVCIKESKLCVVAYRRSHNLVAAIPMVNMREAAQSARCRSIFSASQREAGSGTCTGLKILLNYQSRRNNSS